MGEEPEPRARQPKRGREGLTRDRKTPLRGSCSEGPFGRGSGGADLTLFRPNGAPRTQFAGRNRDRRPQAPYETLKRSRYQATNRPRPSETVVLGRYPKRSLALLTSA